ncbi:MAG: LysE family transporter [Lachnospiraceae bacterium]|nr:LysE family transporter [Lachnospiraceae bacterium]
MLIIMPLSMIPTFLLYCYVGAITPGPANLSSLAAGIRYGKKVALRQWRGLLAGFFIISMLSVLITYLLGTVLNQYVGLLTWIGAGYILWLAWHMLRSSGVSEKDDTAVPCFRTGLLINLTNVKIMVFCLTALASFVLPYTRSFGALLAIGLFLPFTGPLANLVWVFAGASLQKLFVNHKKAVDIVMAASLALCAVSLVWPH